MATYQLYFIARDGRLERVADFDCRDDADCVDRALERADGRPMEVWHGGRLVRRWAAGEAHRT